MPCKVLPIAWSVQSHQSTFMALGDFAANALKVKRSTLGFFWMVPKLSLLRAGVTSGRAYIISRNTKTYQA